MINNCEGKYCDEIKYETRNNWQIIMKKIIVMKKVVTKHFVTIKVITKNLWGKKIAIFFFKLHYGYEHCY